jgi:multicomponent Na+:H+ antiporter subunit A
LRYYLMTILLAIIGLVGFTAFIRHETLPVLSRFDLRLHEMAVCLLIPLACWAAIRAPSRLASIVALGVIGYSVALIFVFFGAPDLAMTQFLIETLTVVLFVFVFYRLPVEQRVSRPVARLRDAAIAISLGCIMTGLVLFTAQSDRSRDVSEYYLNHSAADAHGRNVVNVILVDFRALDTLGEITVLVLAAVGVYSLIKLRPGKDSHG